MKWGTLVFGIGFGLFLSIWLAWIAPMVLFAIAFLTMFGGVALGCWPRSY